MADEAGWVRIRHPEVGLSPNPVHASSFESTWKGLGWEIVPDLVAEASELVGAPVTGLDALTKDQLSDLAREKGVDISGAATKADIVTAIDRSGGGA
jgi:hypothetical protein